MTSLADRLRGVVGGANVHGGPGGREGATLQERVLPSQAAETLGGEWRESSGQQYLVVDRTYAPGHRHGDVALSAGRHKRIRGSLPKQSQHAALEVGSNAV